MHLVRAWPRIHPRAFSVAYSLEPNLSLTTLHSVNHTVTYSSDVGDAFVDDTKVGCTSTYKFDAGLSLQQNTQRTEAEVIEKLGKLSQKWKRLLYATGGALCLAKSFWCLLSWRWNKSGTARPSTIALAPGTLLLTSGNDPNPVEIPRIESTYSFRTLGIRISPAGKQDLAISVLCAQSIDFTTHFSASSLSKEAQKLAGLDLPNLSTRENLGQLCLFLGYLRLKDKTADLILINISYIQVLVGSSTLFFNLPYLKYKCLVDSCWLTSIWAFLSTINFQLIICRTFNPVPL